MKRKPRVHSPSTTKQPRRRTARVNQLEDRFAILLLLLQHNIDALVRHARMRATRR